MQCLYLCEFTWDKLRASLYRLSLFIFIGTGVYKPKLSTGSIEQEFYGAAGTNNE